MTPLAGAEIWEWVALRRVRHGGIAQVDHRWVESGHRLPGHLSVALGALLDRRLIRLADDDPTTGVMGRAALTHAGIDRYERLCQRALQLPGGEFLALCRRFVVAGAASNTGPEDPADSGQRLAHPAQAPLNLPWDPLSAQEREPRNQLER